MCTIDQTKRQRGDQSRPGISHLNSCCPYILKAGVARVQNLQTHLNFPHMDCLRFLHFSADFLRLESKIRKLFLLLECMQVPQVVRVNWTICTLCKSSIASFCSRPHPPVANNTDLMSFRTEPKMSIKVDSTTDYLFLLMVRYNHGPKPFLHSANKGFSPRW